MWLAELPEERGAAERERAADDRDDEQLGDPEGEMPLRATPPL